MDEKVDTKPDPVSDATRHQLREKLDKFLEVGDEVTSLAIEVHRLTQKLAVAREQYRSLECDVRHLLWEIIKHGGSPHIVYRGKMFTRREVSKDHTSGVDVAEAPHVLEPKGSQPLGWTAFEISGEHDPPAFPVFHFFDHEGKAICGRGGRPSVTLSHCNHRLCQECREIRGEQQERIVV
jgi:hypothetical protein